MIKGKEILKQNIVAISTGERVETVQDIIFDHQANRVLGLLVDEGGWFRAAKVVPFDRIRSFGEHAIMIDTPQDVTSTREDGRLAEVLDSKVNLVGMALLTTDGQRLGRIADVYFNEETGAVEGYEATEGMFADLTHGRTFVPAPEAVQIGKDAAIVPMSVAEAMKEQEPGGITGVFKGAADSVKEGVQGVSDSVKGTVENIAEATKERQQQYVIGKTAGNELVADDGTVLVRKGEMITPLHAEVAEWHGKLTALATAATGGVIAGAVGSTTQNVREGAQNAAESVSSTVKGSYENMAEASKERQKEYAVGKTASADLTLDDGRVIVKKGDKITDAQADQAEAAGKLPALAALATGGVLSGLLGAVKERVQDTVEDLKGATAERQKAFVVGKTASRDVTSDAGEVIVKKGSVITQHQADHAEQTGTLLALTTAAELISSPADNATHAAPKTPEAAIGRRARTDVRAPSGSLVAAQGQIITPAIVERAGHLGVTDALLAATTANSVTDTVAGATAGAGAAVAGGLASVTEGASGLLDRAKSWLGDKRDEAEAALQEREQQVQEEAVKAALGRPVTRVILAPNDSVILNSGEIVTNKAVQAARDAGVLDLLLDSVSKEPLAAPVDPNTLG